jgi:hypothetical protein
MHARSRLSISKKKGIARQLLTSPEDGHCIPPPLSHFPPAVDPTALDLEPRRMGEGEPYEQTAPPAKLLLLLLPLLLLLQTLFIPVFLSPTHSRLT